MKVLFSPQPSFISFSSLRSNKPRSFTPFFIQTVPKFSSTFRIGPSECLSIKAVLDSALIEQLGLSESEIRNPTISTSYRSSNFPKPNQTLLDAQARVCTGPNQTRALNEDQAFKVLDTILRSG